MESQALKTAIIIVAPHDVQALAYPLLRQYAPDGAIRVPAHITVLFPFVPFERLDEASETVRQMAASIVPFEVTLDGYGSFPTVNFIQPRDPQPIQAVFRQIYSAFPECPPYEGQFGNDLHPHMTVGAFASEAERLAINLPDFAPLTFRVNRLHLVYGPFGDPLPWITHSVIPLAGA